MQLNVTVLRFEDERVVASVQTDRGELDDSGVERMKMCREQMNNTASLKGPLHSHVTMFSRIVVCEASRI